jgi:hypothetical protein
MRLPRLPRSARLLLPFVLVPLVLAGWMAIIRSATRIRYDVWGMAYAAAHVLAMIMLTVFYGWVLEPEGTRRVVFGWLEGKSRTKLKRDDDWLE